ncbi:MAG TPA: DUF58 domain-containing protein [Acidimicrobiia bacterium]
MSLTTRGWAALGAGLAALVAWPAIGEPALLVTAAVLLAALAIAAIRVGRFRPELDIARESAGRQVPEGGRAEVRLRISTRGSVTPLMVVEDSVGELGRATFSLGRLRPGQEATVRYEVVCRPRGIYAVGPATARWRDDFGLVERSRLIGSAQRLVVVPAVEQLRGLPPGSGWEGQGGRRSRRTARAGGEDFTALRPHRPGDDLRRIHWPATARHEELIVRHFDTPVRWRALVVLDTRAAAYSDPHAFEQAVRGAASILELLLGAGLPPLLWVGGPRLLVPGNEAMSALASARTAADRLPFPPASEVRGTIALVTGQPDEQVRGWVITHAPGAVLAVARSGFEPLGVPTLQLRPHQALAQAWAETFAGQWAPPSAG